jgi:hypothetical protein
MLHSARFGLAALLVLGAACQPRPNTETGMAKTGSDAAAAGLSDEDKAGIRAIDAKWAQAAKAGDGQGIAALYVSDAILLPPGEPMVKGEAAKSIGLISPTAFRDRLSSTPWPWKAAETWPPRSVPTR